MAGTSAARRLYLLAAGGILLLDQTSKAWVGEALVLGELRPVTSFFNLTHARNRGAAFGLFSEAESAAVQVFLIGFSLLALTLVLALLWRGVGSAAADWGLVLIFGGALGNLVDRLRAGSVVDFLDFHWGGYHWPAFNLADSAIVAGAALLLVEVLCRRRTTREA